MYRFIRKYEERRLKVVYVKEIDVARFTKGEALAAVIYLGIIIPIVDAISINANAEEYLISC